MADVTLRDITQANWRECIMLMPAEDQRDYVYSNLYSLAEAKYEPDWGLVPLGVYAGETMVGFVMYGRAVHGGQARWFIFRLMIDQNHQGSGYGRTAMQQVIAILAEKPDCDTVFVSYAPDNTAAQRLYTSLGFADAGMMLDGDVVLQLSTNQIDRGT